MNIAIHIEDGVIQQVTSDDPSLQGARVAVVQADIAERIVEVTYEAKLDALIRAGTDRTMCHAIGMACELAGERLMAMGQTAHDDPVQMIDDMNELVQQLADAVARAVAKLGR